MNPYVMLVIGIAVGWLTKCPFYLKYYEKVRRDKEIMRRIMDRWNEVVKKYDIYQVLKEVKNYEQTLSATTPGLPQTPSYQGEFGSGSLPEKGTGV